MNFQMVEVWIVKVDGIAVATTYWTVVDGHIFFFQLGDDLIELFAGGFEG